jgi:hypothetical protein
MTHHTFIQRWQPWPFRKLKRLYLVRTEDTGLHITPSLKSAKWHASFEAGPGVWVRRRERTGQRGTKEVYFYYEVSQ